MKKSQKLEKEYFFQIELTAKEFLVRNRKLQVLRTKYLKQSFPVFSAAANKYIMSVKSILWTMSCSLQKGQVVQSLLCHGRAQDRFDFLHMAEDSFSCDSGIL